MVMVINRAPGPRAFNVKPANPGDAPQVTLVPGEARELDLAVDPINDRVLQGWIETEQVMVGNEAERFLAKRKPSPEALAKRRAAALAELSEIDALEGGVPDPSLVTPPHQLGSDGGPEQSAQVGGTTHLPTPAQEKDARGAGARAAVANKEK